MPRPFGAAAVAAAAGLAAAAGAIPCFGVSACSGGDSEPEPETEPEPEPEGEPVVPPDGEPLLACSTTSGSGATIDLAEASGATWVVGSIGVGFLVASDQGHAGDGALVAAETLEGSGVDLPLDASSSDDIEGLSRSPDGRIFGITSSGWLRAWSMEGDELVVAQLGKPVSSDPEWVCADPHEANCGPNWEGLCLHPDPPPGSPCAGFALSKAKGDLVCLVADGAGYALDPSIRIEVAKKDRVSDCAYETVPPYRLVVAGNDEVHSILWQVHGLETPGEAGPIPLGLTGAAFQEAIAFGPGGALVSFGDTGQTGGKDSPAVVFACE